jgi:hypothetical protein
MQPSITIEINGIRTLLLLYTALHTLNITEQTNATSPLI